MITINNQYVKINNTSVWICDMPNTVRQSNIKAWFKIYSLNDVTLNFQSQIGTVSTSIGSVNVTGVGTSFTSNDIGKRIRIGSEDKWIVSRISATSITVDSNYISANSGVSYSLGCVSSWINSISGVMGNLEQSTATAQPFIRMIDNKLTITYNQNRDTDYLQTLVAFSLGTKQSYFFKFNCIKTVNESDLFRSITSDEIPRITLQAGQSTYALNKLTSYTNVWKSSAGTVKNSTICYLNNGNGWSIYNQNNMDKTIIGNIGSPIANQIMNSRYIVGNNVVMNSVFSFKGEISEIIIYDDILNLAERDKIFRYLNLKKF